VPGSTHWHWERRLKQAFDFMHLWFIECTGGERFGRSTIQRLPSVAIAKQVSQMPSW